MEKLIHKADGKLSYDNPYHVGRKAFWLKDSYRHKYKVIIIEPQSHDKNHPESVRIVFDPGARMGTGSILQPRTSLTLIND